MNSPITDAAARFAKGLEHVRIRPSEQVEVVRYLAKWIALLTPVAVVVGSTSSAFLWALERATDERFERPWLLYLLPLAGLTVALLYPRLHGKVGRKLGSG